MPRVAAYCAAIGMAAAVAFAVTVLPSQMASHAETAAEQGILVQSVNRATKSDRLRAPVTAIGKTLPPVDRREKPLVPVKLLEGCEPAFSPLSVSRQANIPGRCAV